MRAGGGGRAGHVAGAPAVDCRGGLGGGFGPVDVGPRGEVEDRARAQAFDDVVNGSFVGHVQCGARERVQLLVVVLVGGGGDARGGPDHRLAQHSCRRR